MRLAAEAGEVTVWDNGVMGLDMEQVGLRGSPTQVRRIFSPERVLGEILGDGPEDPEGAADLLVDTLVEKDIVSL